MSYVDIIQPCITWGTHPVSWYRERIKMLGNEYDPGDKDTALKLALTKDEFIYTGVLYETPSENVFAERFRKEVTGGPLTGLGTQKTEDILSLLSEFRQSS